MKRQKRKVSALTGVLGIVGHPIDHTLSPLMHNRAAELLNLDYVYAAFDVAPKDLRKAIAGLRGLGVRGINVTVPHKEKVIPFLDSLDEEVLLTGAVNTITLENGRLTGSNTDGKGFIKSLTIRGFDLRDKKVAIVGAGGSARAIGVAVCQAGAEEVTVINRSAPRGRRLARHLSQLGKVAFVSASSDNAAKAVRESDIIVQTTPCGMKRSDPLPPISAGFRKEQLVYDIIYSVETRFLQKAKSKGASTVNGLEMLVYQGSESFRIWTGSPFPDGKILGLLKRTLCRR